MHDPTTLNAQGQDRGTQYRSAIFTHSDEQAEKANSILGLAQRQWWNGQGTITTAVMPAGKWWDAEEYHQLYLHKSSSPFPFTFYLGRADSSCVRGRS